MDYRVWKNGTNINPLTIPQEPAEPIKKENLDSFTKIRDRIIAELDGKATPEMIVTQLDSLDVATSNTEVINNDAKK